MKQLCYIAVLAIGLAVAGCRSTPTQTAITTEGVVITSVDTGMQVWSSYVKQHVSDGKVTQKQVDTVHTAYDAYYTAQQAAKAVLEKSLAAGSSVTAADVATANAAVNNAEAALLSVLNQYIVK